MVSKEGKDKKYDHHLDQENLVIQRFSFSLCVPLAAAHNKVSRVVSDHDRDGEDHDEGECQDQGD